MERGNAKHGPRLDDQLEREISGGRVEEGREPEVNVDLTLTDEELEGRSRLGRYLPRSLFPADRRKLLAAARAENAPDDVIEQIEQLPEDVRFETVARAWSALGHPLDQRF